MDVVLHVFRSGGSSKLDIPKPVSAFPNPQPILSSMNNDERSKLYKERVMLKRQKAEMYSLWCDALYRLSLANHVCIHHFSFFTNLILKQKQFQFCGKIFWLPHNMDFRGRVYPCPPHLNHLGSDMARSLLCFAKGEPLGHNGLNWLKVSFENDLILIKLFKHIHYYNEFLYS